MRWAAFAAALGLALAACAPTPAPLPSAPVGLTAPIHVEAQAVPLDPTEPGRDRIGAFAYAGGLALTSADTARLHGLSDLKVWPNGRFLVQGDEADQVEGRIRLDAKGRLIGLDSVRIHALKDADGQDLYAKGQRMRDAESVAELPNGDRLVGFEENDRVLLYPANGGPPREAPKPDVKWVFNKGMEALDFDPAAGRDGYRVGVEASGATFVCRVSAACVPGPTVALGDGYELSGLAVLPKGRTAYLLRAFDPARGNRIRLRIEAADGAVVDELMLARPLSVDNIEGVGAAPRPDGSIRFYLVSDDNFGTYNGLPTHQRTLLLAFDWRPPQGR